MSRFYGDFDPAATADTVVGTSVGFSWDTSVNSSYYTFADNFTVQRSGSASWGYPAVSTAVFTEGKFSIDFRVNTVDSSTKRTNFGIVATSQVSIGGSNWLHKPFNDNTAHSAGVQDENFSTGDIFTLNVNFDDKSLEVLQNNSSVGSDTFSTSGNFHIALQEYSNTSTFEVVAQVYAPPTGFTKITQTSGIISTTTDTRSHSHVWNYSDVYDARSADSWPASSVFHPSSPSLVSLYIPGDTDIADASIHGHTLTATPGAAVSSAASVFGGASVYFDGGSYLNLSVSTSPATSTALVFGTGDFTLEYFINNHPNNSNVNMMHPENESNTGTGYWAHLIQDRKLRWNHQYDVANLWEVNASADLFDNTFHHVAIVRNSGTFKVFIDGQSRSADSGTFTDSSNYVYSSGYQIGGHGNIAGGGQLLGYLDDFRITKHAVYTTAFTVPTVALGIQTFL